VLGSTYSATIDLAGTTGHGFAWLVGFATPTSLALPGGQVLLVNTADPTGELFQQAPRSGVLVQYDLTVPSDVTLIGFAAATQALHFGALYPVALSNAMDLVLGV